VGDGTYQEIIDFKGKPLTVVSENGPTSTSIDGNYLGTSAHVMVDFKAGNSASNTTLKGFMITGGYMEYQSNNCAGVRFVGASATLDWCDVFSNRAHTASGVCSFSTSGTIPPVTVTNSTIRNNTQLTTV
jgi:hypothetical protein